MTLRSQREANREPLALDLLDPIAGFDALIDRGQLLTPRLGYEPIPELGQHVANILRTEGFGGGLSLREPVFPEQRLLVESPAKRIIVRAGRRGGKTVGAAIKAVRGFLQGRRILYAAPITEQINRFWKEVTSALQESIDAGIYRKNETRHFIERRGTEQAITAKTAWSADSLRGDYGDLLILDEFQLMNEDVWGQVGAPMLLDNNGDAVFIYTPPSLRSRSVSKADDPRHAPKMFARAEAMMKEAASEGRESRWLAIHWTSHDNPTISETALAEITEDMTALSYRQEIMAEDSSEVPGALWKQSVIDDSRVDRAPVLARIVVGIDPSATSTDLSDEAGIITAGLGVDGHGYCLKDSSKRGTPLEWGTAGVSDYHEFKADRLIGETNNGGEMVELTVRTVDPNVSYKGVHASRGKLVRAEPVCALQEKKRIHFVGEFPELESEMCSYVPGSKSPNRMDAMVWAFTELMLENRVLGLLDYYAEGRAKQELEDMQKVTAAGNLRKPMVAEDSPRCPECESGAVVRAGRDWHCNQCGIQFPAKDAAPTDGHSIRRDQYLKDHDVKRGRF